MSSLRESENSEGEDEDRMANTMGFSSFGKKKTRTFDVMAMFEQTRRIAMERSQATLVSRSEEPVIRKPAGTQSSSSSSGSSSDDSDSDSDTMGPQPASHRASSKITHSKNRRTAESEEDEEVIGPPLPPSMLKSSTDVVVDDNVMGPPLPPGMKKSQDSDDDDDDEDDEEEETLEKRIPDTHEVVLNHGYKTVSALGLDPSGARLVSGGYDYEVKLWDFAGMDSSLKFFRSFMPCESHQIKSLEYSSTGEHILVVSGNAQAKVLDRDGFEVLECFKGDQYIVDQSKTRGHTAMLNSGCWHPKIKEEFMTCSNDGTLRLWDVNGNKKPKHVIKPRSSQGRRSIPVSCTFSRDGLYVAGACQDGSIQLWDHRKNYVNVAIKNMSAHMNGSDTSCLCFSYDNRLLASRGGDDTLKTWDIRNFKQPVKVAKDLINLFPMTDCMFSPDDRLIVTGVSVKKGEGMGKLVFLDRVTLDKMYELQVSDSSVVRCLWHPKLNQIFTGSGDGTIRMYYDPDKSHRGAKLCVVKAHKKKKQVETLAAQNIMTPHALPMFRKERPRSTKKQEEKDRKDPAKSHRPDLPITGPGQGGRVANRGATLSQYVVQTMIMRKPDERDKDPRAAILRHAKEAEENPFWISPAYSSTQPTTVFQEEEEEEEEDDEPAWKKQKI